MFVVKAVKLSNYYFTTLSMCGHFIEFAGVDAFFVNLIILFLETISQECHHRLY